MKYLIIAASLLSLSAGAAFAGEGQGDPFGYNAPGPIMTDIPTSPVQANGQTPLFAKLPPTSTSYGRTTMAGALRQFESVPVTSGTVLPSDGSQGEVQSANSLPRGFEQGTVAYEQAQSVQRYLAQQDQRNAHRAYAQSPQPSATRAGG